MIYEVLYSEQADKDIKEHKKSDPASYKKITKFIEELHAHPRTGTGHPEPLRGGGDKVYSRKINKKDKLWYRIEDEQVFVFIASAKGHYNDK